MRMLLFLLCLLKPERSPKQREIVSFFSNSPNISFYFLLEYTIVFTVVTRYNKVYITRR